VGQQTIAKFKDLAKNVVNIYMFVVRLEQAETDIMITFNDPVLINPQSSSSEAQNPTTPEENVALMRTIVSSLKIHDWSLFHPEDQEPNDS
jgi:hypothetical protein